ncbi:LPD38 domain-containing protein [Metabacillus dongyingensis]|uniref:LPD38 domain-containing protein n=1 Tax=Metabacillus dongyingensis TaxID=2874282 RepID=UPI003B8BAB39
MAYNSDKYKKIFEKSHGKGSYDAGLASAREIGKLKTQAEFAKTTYISAMKKAQSEAAKKAKEAEKLAEEQELYGGQSKKSYNATIKEVGKTTAIQEKAQKQGRGGHMPDEKQLKKEKDIQAEYKRTGVFPSNIQKMIDNLDFGDADQINAEHAAKKAKEREAKKKKEKNGLLDFISNFGKDSKSKSKKKKNSLLDDITTPLKNFGKGVGYMFDGDKKTNMYTAIEENNKDAAESERSTVTKESGRALSRIANTATLGALKEGSKRLTGEDNQAFKERENSSTAGKVADFAYDAAGYLIPGMGAYKAVRGAGLGVKAGSKGVQKVGQLAKEGSIAGAALGAGEVGVREALNPDDYNFKDNAQLIGLGAAAGAIADPALYGAGKAISSGLSRTLKGNVPEFTGRPSESTLDRLAPRSSSPGNNFQSNDLFDRLSRNGLTPPRNSMTPEASAQFSAKNEFDEAVENQYQYLKGSLQNRKGVQQGNVIRDELGDVVSKYGRISENPQWYSEFYSQNGKVPNNQELRALAEKHVREGFSDEFGDVPAWKPSEPTTPEIENINSQIDELESMIYQSPGEESAIRPLIDALEQEKSMLISQPPRSTNTASGPSLRDRLAPIQNNQVAASRAPLEYENISSGGADPGLRRVNPTLADETVQTSGNADSFRNKIDRNSAKKENNFFSTLRTQFIDDVAPLENLEKQITGKVASAENSLYKQARLYKGSPEKAHLIVQEQLTPIINEVQKTGSNIQDLGDYALAVHAKDVNAKGINSGFTNAEIDDVINRLGSESMEAARKNLVKVNDDVLRMLSTGDSPVLNPSDVDAMRAKWPNYMSLFRSFDDDKIEFASGLSKALSVGSSPIKKLEGSSRNVIDPIESVVKNIFKATSVADRNKVASQLSKLAEVDTDGLVRKLPDGEDAGRMNVISAMENGKRVKYEVPPDVYKAMTNLDKESSNTLIKILQKPASTLRAGATLTPEFSLRNPLRDVPNAFVVSNSGFNPVIDFPVGLWQSIWKGRTIKIGGKEFKTSGDLYKQFIKENGGYGNIVSMDRELHQETLKKALTDASTHYVDVLNPQVYKSLMKKFANPLNALRNVADVSETATKVGEFRAALRSGTSPQEAGYRARDIMDFARAGVSVREANKVVAFLNANMQGKSKLWRAFKENPAKVGGKAIAAVTIPTIGAIVAQNTYANDRQKEILNDAPQWLKDTFYLVPIPGTNQIARIPKPFDLAFMFSNPLERAFDFAAKNDKEAFDGFMKQAFSAMAVPTMLTGVAPIVEGMANYSFFRQGPIIPQREENINYPDQYDINTTETGKFLGSQINKVTGGKGAFRNFGSPRVIDNTIQGFTGGLGTYATSSIDWFLDETKAIDKPEKPAKGIDQLPVAKAFLVNQNTSGKSLEKLYNLKDKLADARGSAKQNGKPFEDEQKYNVANRLTKGLAGLNKQIRTVENSPELSGEEKKTQLEMLIRQRNEAARKAMETLNNME